MSLPYTSKWHPEADMKYAVGMAEHGTDDVILEMVNDKLELIKNTLFELGAMRDQRNKVHKEGEFMMSLNILNRFVFGTQEEALLHKGKTVQFVEFLAIVQGAIALHLAMDTQQRKQMHTKHNTKKEDKYEFPPTSNTTS